MAGSGAAVTSQNDRFRRAMVLVMSEFLPKAFYAARKMTAVSGQLDAAMAQREAPEVLVLESYFPWASELFKHEKGPEVQFVIHPAPQGTSFNLRTVDKDPTNRMAGKRCEFPPAWAGLNEAALDAATAESVPAGCVFCHKARFIAGHKTLAGAKAMAAEALGQKPAAVGSAPYRVVEVREPKAPLPPAGQEQPPAKKKLRSVAGFTDRVPTYADVQQDLVRMTANLVQLSGKIGALSVLHRDGR